MGYIPYESPPTENQAVTLEDLFHALEYAENFVKLELIVCNEFEREEARKREMERAWRNGVFVLDGGYGENPLYNKPDRRPRPRTRKEFLERKHLDFIKAALERRLADPEQRQAIEEELRAIAERKPQFQGMVEELLANESAFEENMICLQEEW